MLSWRTSALLSIVPIALLVVLALTRPGDPPPHELPPVPTREEIARAQTFFKRAEAVCYRSWGQMRKLRKAQRPEDVGPMVDRIVSIHERAVARLEALGPPPPAAARKFRHALRVLRARNREMTRALRYFTPRTLAHASRGDVRRKLRRRGARGRRLNAELDAIADPLGLWKCRK